MADFCRHCSVIVFDEDFKDFEDEPADQEDERLWTLVLCEHCGFTLVDWRGVSRLCPINNPFKPVLSPEELDVWENQALLE